MRQETFTDRLISYALIGLCGLVILSTLGCFGGGSSPGVIKPTPPGPGPDPGIVTPAPPTTEANQVKRLFFYDPCYGNSDCNVMWEGLRATSNTIMLRGREGEWRHVLAKGPRAAGFVEAVAAIDDGDTTDLIAIIKEARAAGLECDKGIIGDEPLLGGLGEEYLNHRLDTARVALDAAGLGDVRIGFTYALVDWDRDFTKMARIPIRRIIFTDGWYAAEPSEMHNVRHRMISWLEFLESKGFINTEIVPVIKGFSRVPPDLAPLTPDWLTRQLNCVGGGGTSEYDWKNPNTGEIGHVILQPVPDRFLSRTKMIGIYCADFRRRWDVDTTPLNLPGGVEAVRAWARPRGLTAK